MQLGGNAFTVRGQSINDSLEMMSMLASYGQIRERISSLSLEPSIVLTCVPLGLDT